MTGVPISARGNLDWRIPRALADFRRQVDAARDLETLARVEQGLRASEIPLHLHAHEQVEIDQLLSQRRKALANQEGPAA